MSYSEDFESTIETRPSTATDLLCTDDVDGTIDTRPSTAAEVQYSEDFEQTIDSRPSTAANAHYSEDFHTATEGSSCSTSGTGDPSSESSAAQTKDAEDYSADFISMSETVGKTLDGTVATAAKSTGSGIYSDDFEDTETQSLSRWTPEPAPRTHIRGNLQQSADLSQSQDCMRRSTGFITPSPKPRSQPVRLSMTYSPDLQTTESFSEETVSESASKSAESVVASPRKPVADYTESDLSETASYFSTVTSDDEYTTTSFQDFERDDEAFAERKAEQDYITKKLKILREPPAREMRPVPTPRPPPLDPESRKHMWMFVQKKLKVLQRRKHGVAVSAKKRPEQNILPGRLPPNSIIEEWGIPSSAVTRLKMENTMHQLKKVAQADIHEPKKCKSCREKLAEFAQKEYLKRKLAIANAKLTDHKLDDLNIQYNDQVGLMAEALRGLPTLKDDPDDILKKLFQPLQEAKKGEVTRKTLFS